MKGVAFIYLVASEYVARNVLLLLLLLFFLLILEMALDASQICSWQRQMCHHGCKLNVLEGAHQSCLLIIAQRYNIHFEFSTHREMSTISMREIWLFSCRCCFFF